MTRPRHLRNAPITEALFDFRVKARIDFRNEEFLPLQAQLADRFPKMEDRHRMQAIFEVEGGKGRPPVIQKSPHGYFFKSEDEKTVVQFRVDGFTLNRLRPYTSWDELFPLVIDLWRLYCTTARPEVITRLAVRYINRIPLPPGPIRTETYLRAGPTIPQELPQHISSFLTRVTIHDLDADIAAHVAQALEVDVSRQQSIVILDIDAFRQGEVAVGDTAVEETLNRLRKFKNLIFFSSLTEETMRQFE